MNPNLNPDAHHASSFLLLWTSHQVQYLLQYMSLWKLKSRFEVSKVRVEYSELLNVSADINPYFRNKHNLGKRWLARLVNIRDKQSAPV